MKNFASKHVDRWLLFFTILMVLVGFFVFSSASLGLLARDGLRFSDVAMTQLVLGIGGGLFTLFVLSRIHYRVYRRPAPYLFGAGLLLTALVFIPNVGYEAYGANRWLLIAGMSFQPVELLKITYVLFLAWYYSTFYTRLSDLRYALGGLVLALFLSALVLIPQPDTGNFLIIACAGAAMVFVAGMRMRHMVLMSGILFLCVASLVAYRPHLLDRVTTFMRPDEDPTGSGYQIRQSLIAVGSGGIAGRGYGQSVQKFSHLPEPIGDSIFSVAAEEFGFIGSMFILCLYVLFAVRSLIISARAPDRFGGLIIIGFVILLVAQSFMNVASMIGVMPLTGRPLVFMSHGGTSLLFALASVGIMLNVSRYQLKMKPISKKV
jgi:cell division protein FtsW